MAVVVVVVVVVVVEGVPPPLPLGRGYMDGMGWDRGNVL